MKYSILFLLGHLLTTPVFADSTNTGSTTSTANSAISDETKLNQTLLDNAAKSEQILNSSTKTATPTSIKILSNKGSSSTTTSSANLTDQEKQLSENYVDQGLANKIIEEKCTGDMKQACAGTEVDHKVMGMSPALMKAAAQAYATMGAMTDFLPLSAPKSASTTATTGSGGTNATTNGSTPPAADSAANKAQQGGDKANETKPTDYCKYIPAATETIATFAQKNTTDSLSSSDGTTSQKDGLLKAAKSHDSRAQQAQIQAYGWYGGAACYAVRAATQTVAVDTALIVKLGAATLLGTFYQEEVSANKGYAQKTRDIANALPGKGYCNPITQNDCYCSETPQPADYATYCKAQIAAKQAAANNFTRVACTNDKMQLDPTCTCDRTNTCFDKYIENQSGGSFQLGFGTTGASPFKAIASLAHGKLENGTLGAQSYSGSAAVAKQALNELGNKVPARDLTPAEKTIADAIASKGIPANVARLMASNSPSPSAVNSAMAKLSGLGSGPAQLAAVSSGGQNNILDFSGGSGLGTGTKRAGDKKSGMEDFLAKVNPNAKTVTPGKIIEFAQKAEKQASQITKTDRSVFEIISLRYQTSGRKRLELDSSN